MKPKRKIQTYKDFVKRPPPPPLHTVKQPGDLELVYGRLIRHGN